MLFTFPSRYWFAIGLSGVFSLAGWSRRIHARFLVPRATQDTAGFVSLHVRACHPLWCDFPDASIHEISCRRAVLQPRACRNTRGLGSSPFARHYWGNHSYFLFLRVLRCFSSPRWPPAKPDDIPSGYRVVPFGDLRIKGHLRLPAAFRSLSRPSSPPRAKASAMRPFLLSFIPHRSRQRSACFSFGFLTLVFLVHHVIDRTERPARRAAFRCGE